jgi:hypothetical protein
MFIYTTRSIDSESHRVEIPVVFGFVGLLHRTTQVTHCLMQSTVSQKLLAIILFLLIFCYAIKIYNTCTSICQ